MWMVWAGMGARVLGESEGEGGGRGGGSSVVWW